MILTWLIVEVFAGGILAWIAGRWGQLWPRVISLVTLSAHMVVMIVLWVHYFGPGSEAERALGHRDESRLDTAARHQLSTCRWTA